MKTWVSILLWIASVILMALFAIYQRRTGPTYPKRVEIELNEKLYKFKLPRSQGGESDAEVAVVIPDETIVGYVKYGKYSRNVILPKTELEMRRVGDTLVAHLPNLPPAGKYEYMVFLGKDMQSAKPALEEYVRIRFKGDVPTPFLIAHVAFIFFAFVLSLRTGLEAVFKGKNIFAYTFATTIFLFLAVMILGPIIQKYAFGAYWTGWPLGEDLTDNKSLVAMIFWIVALWRTWKNRENRFWPILASIALIVVFLIPHSAMGSEIDWSETPHP